MSDEKMDKAGKPMLSMEICVEDGVILVKGITQRPTLKIFAAAAASLAKMLKAELENGIAGSDGARTLLASDGELPEVSAMHGLEVLGEVFLKHEWAESRQVITERREPTDTDDGPEPGSGRF